MQRTMRLALLLTLLPGANVARADDGRHTLNVLLELDALGSDEHIKLAAGTDADFARIALGYDARLKPTLNFHAVVDAVDDGSGGIDFTEAFLDWQPVPRSPFRHEVRAGVFYPPLSLENTGPAWTSPYGGSFSAVNTWIGEELRTIGAEWRLTRTLGSPARQRQLGFVAATYYANDPAGALLAWRGWALHERQSRLGDAIRLPDLPQFAPGMMFEVQAPATEPFAETDHSPGYYYGLELELGRRVRLTALHYDNHADPLSLQEGHYGWTTRFDHIGAQFELPAGLGLIVQWLDGTTAMGPVMAPAATGYHVVDNGFDAAFALLTKQHGPHRWSLRLDDFGVTDLDQIPLDDNGEAGRALSLAWQYEVDAHWTVGIDWQALELTRPALAYAGQSPRHDESLLKLGMRYRLGPTPR